MEHVVSTQLRGIWLGASPVKSPCCLSRLRQGGDTGRMGPTQRGGGSGYCVAVQQKLFKMELVVVTKIIWLKPIHTRLFTPPHGQKNHSPKNDARCLLVVPIPYTL